MKEIYVKVTENGPYMVYGNPEISEKIIAVDDNNVCVAYSDGKVFEIKSDPVALCRCGCTNNAPFCDGSHNTCLHERTETSSFDPILDNAEKYEGPNYTLADNETFCAYARFCDANGSIWNLIFNGDENSNSEILRQAKMCPSGRLIVFDKNGQAIEESYPQSIAVLEDDGLKISGPLWLRGGIRVESADGKSYEIRNRQTLCRCGKSKNKPFCDSTHTHINFKAKKNS